MKILLLCTAFNSLSQRVALVLKSHGHAVTVEFALSPEVMLDAAKLASPDIIICPFLTKKIPSAIYNRYLTLIIHPGPPGDAGPSALDWMLIGDLGEHVQAEKELHLLGATSGLQGKRPKMRSHWGVTVLQAIEAFDAGPVWAFEQFELDEYAKGMTKSELYRGPVTQAAINATLAAVELVKIVAARGHDQQVCSAALPAPEFAQSHCVSRGLPFLGGETHDRPLLKASSRDFCHWRRSSEQPVSAASIVQRIRSADSQPGVLTNLLGAPLFVYNAITEKGALPAHVAARITADMQGTILATREGAILVDAGADHPIWVSHLRRPKTKKDNYLHPKLPATMVLLSIPQHASRLGLFTEVPEWGLNSEEDVDARLPWKKREGTFQQVWVELEPICESQFLIGYIHTEFYNGAFSTLQCEIFLKAIRWTLVQPGLQAIVMLGGTSYFSNGIALNVIEGSPDPSAEGWANINAIDDCVQALLAPSGIVTFAAIRGNAAAGGLALATAADVVLCAEGAVLNPHYRGIGLFGSEYHTYSWYARCGADAATKFTRDMLPMSAKDACKIGLVDHVIENNKMNSATLLTEIKTIIGGIMATASTADKVHVGAVWTRPLLPVPGASSLSLPQHMLRNKAKFLAYTFAGNGQDHLSIAEHFEAYREHELHEMSLDLFHPHRKERFASRCTAFVRKIVPSTTPFRFALHRRHMSGAWEEAGEHVLRDIEEVDTFDSLGQYPASAAVPRYPSHRPEYLARHLLEETTPRLLLKRNDSSFSMASTACSGLAYPNLSPSLSIASEDHFSFPPVTPTLMPSSSDTIMNKGLSGDDEHPTSMPLSHETSLPTLKSSILSPTHDGTTIDPLHQPELPILWSCYYCEDSCGTVIESSVTRVSLPHVTSTVEDR